jgi:flagellin-like protein
MKMRKGVSPVIAIVIILLIVVSIAGAAWSYISGYWGGLTRIGIEITNTICNGTAVTIYVHNIGTDAINLSKLDITRTVSVSTANAPIYVYEPADGRVVPGTTGKIIDVNCASDGIERRCTYMIVPATGRGATGYADCTGV